MKEYALIVAGGMGTRIRSEVPKQFMVINGLPVLMHTLKAFDSYSSDLVKIVVLPGSQIGFWQLQCKKYNYSSPHILTPGGDTRFQSVKAGLNRIETDGLVAIHDGVRPLVSKDIIAASYRLAAIHDVAIAAVRLKESLRRIDQDTTRTADRSLYRLIQTPQTFKVSLIKEAYTVKEVPHLTDDASVAEMAGLKISLFEGSYENIKITTPDDLRIVETLLKRNKN